MGYSPNNLLTSTQGGDAGQGLHNDGDWPTPINTGGLTTVPEAAVTHEHPTVECELKKPCPSLLRSELLTNQVTDSPMLWNEMIPFELNSPWAYKRNELLDIRGISSVVACVQAAPFDGACSQIRNWIRVIGVAVGDGSAVLELPPQLSNSVVITKASTGAKTKHLFCHIKHPAMPWQLRRCQAVPKKNEANGEFDPRELGALEAGSRSSCRVVRTKERRASREGGGSPMPACSRPALRRTSIRLPGGVSNRSAVQ
jgi:hypothetical protein